jgi:hypothetical protein
MLDMIVLFHLNCVVELVEREKYFEMCCSVMDSKSEFELELKEAYDYAKTGRGQLLDEVDKALMNMDNNEFQKYLEADKYSKWETTKQFFQLPLPLRSMASKMSFVKTTLFLFKKRF